MASDLNPEAVVGHFGFVQTEASVPANTNTMESSDVLSFPSWLTSYVDSEKQVAAARACVTACAVCVALLGTGNVRLVYE